MLDLNSKYYPRDVYSHNENITRENMRKYDEKRNKWYDMAEKMYPNFYKMRRNSNEKIQAIESINKIMGYSI